MSSHFCIHPGRLTWNLQITHLERKMIFQTSMIMFHVNLQGCIYYWPLTQKSLQQQQREPSCPTLPLQPTQGLPADSVFFFFVRPAFSPKLFTDFFGHRNPWDLGILADQIPALFQGDFRNTALFWSGNTSYHQPQHHVALGITR